MKITCNNSEKEELMEVIAAGCIHIGNGETHHKKLEIKNIN